MKLVEFRVKNFRGIEEIAITDLGDFNIFVGKNNSGKSTIMDAIQFFLRGLRPELQHGHGDEAHDQMWPEGRSDIREMEFEVVFQLNEKDFEMATQRTRDFEELCSRFDCKVTISRKMTQEKQWTTTGLSVRGYPVFPGVSRLNINGQNVHNAFARIPHGSKRIDVVRGRVPDSSSMRGMRNTLIPEKTLQIIKSWVDSEASVDKKRFVTLNDIFRQLTGKSWELRQEGEHLRLTDGTHLAHVRDIGGGIQEMVQLAFELVEVPEFLLVEEPESHSHPEQVKRIFRVLRDISQQKQVFVATHSTFFLELSKFTEIYHVQEIDGHTVCQHIASDQLNSVALDLGLSPVDFHMASGFVFVEGDCEEIVFPAWAEMFNYSLTIPDAKIVNMKGTGKAEHHITAYDILNNEIDLPMVWIFDKIRALKMRDKLRRIGINDDAIVILDKGDIEDYYPFKSLKEHLVNRWNLKKEDKLDAALEMGNRVKLIQEFLEQNANPAPDKSNDWKIPAARHIAMRTAEDEYSKEEYERIKEIMERVNKILSN